MFGFLAQIPAMLAKGAQTAGSAIGHGAQAAGKGILGGVRKTTDALMKARGGDGLQLPNAQMPAPTGVLTPGINPGARMPDIGGAMAPRQLPSVQGLGSPMVDLPTRVTPSIMTEAAAPEVAMPGMIPKRELPEVRVPQLPGRKGPMLEDTPYNRARYEYVTDDLTDEGKVPRSWKTSLLSALMGAGQAAQNPNAGLGDMLGGAIGGGLGGTFNPTRGRENIFNASYGRDILGDEQRGFEGWQRQHARTRGDQDIALGQARIDDLNARNKRPKVGEATWGTYDTETGQPIWQRPAGQSSTAAPRRYNVNGALVDESGNVIYQGEPKRSQMTLSDAMAEETANEGTVEQIAQDSLAGRLDSLKQKLPAQYQSALDNPDDPYYMEAQQAWTKLQDSELNKIRREVSERRRSNAGMRRRGESRSPSRSSGGARSTVPRDYVEEYAREKGVTFDQALKAFQAKGIQVR